MKIYLCQTPEVSSELTDQVLEIVNCCNGPLQFELLPLTYDFERHEFLQYFHYNVNFIIDSTYKKQDYIRELGPPLSWRELFAVCDTSREQHDLNENDLVICLTNRRNSMNYFSMFDLMGERNAFITCSDWEHFVHSGPVFPVAFEVVANMLQLLGWHHLPGAWDFANYHEKSIGCFNDYCVNKSEIMLKLRTGDICQKCIQHMLHEGVSEAVILQSLEIFEKIRRELMFSQGFRGSVRPRPLEVIQGRTILIGDNELQLSPMLKTLFLFFLNHPEGVRVVDLQDYEEEIFRLYESLRGNADPDQIANLVNPAENNFSYTKSRLNRALVDQLGQSLAAFYTVNGEPGEPFKINLPEEMVAFREEVCR